MDAMVEPLAKHRITLKCMRVWRAMAVKYHLHHSLINSHSISISLWSLAYGSSQTVWQTHGHTLRRTFQTELQCVRKTRLRNIKRSWKSEGSCIHFMQIWASWHWWCWWWWRWWQNNERLTIMYMAPWGSTGCNPGTSRRHLWNSLALF